MSYISDDEFARLVSEDVKNKISSRQKQILLNPSFRNRWQRALLMLIENVENQLEDINSDREADRRRYRAMGSDGTVLLQESETAYSTRTMKIERFKFHINKRLDDVAKLIESDSVIDHEFSLNENTEMFKKAILKHRSLYKQFDIEPTGIDSALWRVLDNHWAFEELDESNI